MHWSDARIHVIDFEGCLRSGILEFGVATIFGGRIVQTRTRLCRPLGRIEESDIAVHRIRPSEVADAPLFSEEWRYFSDLRGTGALAAHFAGAENHLLKSVWPYPPPSPDFSSPGRLVNEWGPWIDTGRLYGNLFPELNSANLQNLVARFDLQEELEGLAEEHCPAARCAYHAALYDALAAALLLTNLLQREELCGATLPWLHAMSCSPGRRDRLAQQDLFEA
jgi:DNA polymerase III epsilon subunit-like protein